MQSQDFAVHHHIDRSIQIEFDLLRGFALRQRMLDMRSVIEPRQIANQPQPPNRPPANIFDQAIVDIRPWARSSSCRR